MNCATCESIKSLHSQTFLVKLKQNKTVGGIELRRLNSEFFCHRIKKTIKTISATIKQNKAYFQQYFHSKER